MDGIMTTMLERMPKWLTLEWWEHYIRFDSSLALPDTKVRYNGVDLYCYEIKVDDQYSVFSSRPRDQMKTIVGMLVDGIPSFIGSCGGEMFSILDDSSEDQHWETSSTSFHYSAEENE